MCVELERRGTRALPYLVNMSDTISISVSAAAIFSAEVGCGRPPPNRNDIVNEVCVLCVMPWWCCRRTKVEDLKSWELWA